MSENSGLIIDALLKTDPLLAKSIDAGNSWKAALIKNGARTKLFREYERGDHRAKVTDAMLAMLRVKVGDDKMNDFAINQCEAVIEKESALIYVSSFTVDNAAKDWLSETLKRNSFGARQVEDISGTLRDGNAYTMVGADAIWTSEPSYDGFSGLTVIYSTKTRKAIWACKLWSEALFDIEDNETKAKMKVVVYQPDKISYWEGEVGGDIIVPDASADEQEKSWALGRIPIVSYVNRGKNYMQLGQSELRNVISPQDMLNRTLHSLISAVEQGGFPIRWSIGAEIDVENMTIGGVVNLAILDEDGKPKTEYTPEDIAFLNAIKTGQYDAVQIPPFLDVMNNLVQHIGFVSQTPLLGMTISGGVSGDALRQLNAGLISKATRYTQQNTDAYVELLQLTADIQNTFDTEFGDAPELGAISVNWKDIEILNVDERLDSLGKMSEKLPNKLSDEFYISESLALLGYSQSAIGKEIEKAKERQGMAFDIMTGAAGNVPIVA